MHPSKTIESSTSICLREKVHEYQFIKPLFIIFTVPQRGPSSSGMKRVEHIHQVAGIPGAIHISADRHYISRIIYIYTRIGHQLLSSKQMLTSHPKRGYKYHIHDVEMYLISDTVQQSNRSSLFSQYFLLLN